MSLAALGLLGCSTTLDPTIAPAADDGGSVATSDCVELELDAARYWICRAPLVSFELARTDCRRRNAELASVTSQEENDFLASSAGELDTHTNLWLGGKRDAEHVWSWPDGTVFWNGRADGAAPAGAYANWKAGEPNDASTVSDEPEECAVLTLFDTRWNDRACSLELSYICKLVVP